MACDCLLGRLGRLIRAAPAPYHVRTLHLQPSEDFNFRSCVCVSASGRCTETTRKPLVSGQDLRARTLLAAILYRVGRLDQAFHFPYFINSPSLLTPLPPFETTNTTSHICFGSEGKGQHRKRQAHCLFSQSYAWRNSKYMFPPPYQQITRTSHKAYAALALAATHALPRATVVSDTKVRRRKTRALYTYASSLSKILEFDIRKSLHTRNLGLFAGSNLLRFRLVSPFCRSRPAA